MTRKLSEMVALLVVTIFQILEELAPCKGQISQRLPLASGPIMIWLLVRFRDFMAFALQNTIPQLIHQLEVQHNHRVGMTSHCLINKQAPWSSEADD